MLAVLPESRIRPRLGEVEDPRPAAGEVLVAVRAAALNRADLLQLAGDYPPPAGESSVPGLECAGVIRELGEGVTGWAEGERVMALVAGGGQAELAAVPAGQLLRIPEHLSFTAAAALPEVAITAWTNLVDEGELAAGQAVLITAAASGVGSFAVQLARELGARVLVAGRNLERLATLLPLGAAACLELSEDLPAAVRQATDGRGVDLVFDMAGGVHLDRCLAALAPRGRLVLVGLLAGRHGQLDLGRVLTRRLQIRGSVLRSRSRAEKARLVAAFSEFGQERLDDGRLVPVVDRVLPFAEIESAYEALEAGGVLGKVVVAL